MVLLDPDILSTPVCSLSGHEPPHRSQTFMLLGTGGLGLFVPGMLVFMAYPSTLANAGWKELPKLEYQAQVFVLQALKSSTCPATQPNCWHLYVASGGLEYKFSFSWAICLPYHTVELDLPGFWDHSFPSPRPTACQS